MVGVAPVPETAGAVTAYAGRGATRTAPAVRRRRRSSSGSSRSDISWRPPSTKKRMPAITKFTIRLDRKIVISLEGSPLSSITELVMVP